MIDLTPGPVVDMTVATAEAMDKPLLMASLLAQSIGTGILATRLVRGGHRGELLPIAHGALAGVAAASRPDSSSPASFAAGALGAVAGSGALRRLSAGTAGADRLAVLVAAGGLAVATRALHRRRYEALSTARAAVSLPSPARPDSPPPPGSQLEIDGLSPLFTPTPDFYVTDVTFPPPRVDPGDWRLRVGGLVSRELDLSLDDLLAMDLVEVDATLACVHNPVGGPRIGTGRWLGVAVADLLERAGVRPGAEQLLARSVDGFTAGVPLQRITGGQPALVAVGLNGEPLPFANGFPARLLVPGLWGADANTKWLGELELTTWAEVEDYWDARGWPRQSSPVRPGSRIDVPAHRSHLIAGPVTVAGVAWAPPSGVEGVEVSVDGGPWLKADLAAELAPTAWRQWSLDWDAVMGSHRIRVRSIGRNAAQAEEPAPPYPAGSSGFAENRVFVGARIPRSGPVRGGLEGVADFSDDAWRRLRLAAMAPPAWIRHGFPGRPDDFGPPGVGQDDYPAGSERARRPGGT